MKKYSDGSNNLEIPPETPLQGITPLLHHQSSTSFLSSRHACTLFTMNRLGKYLHQREKLVLCIKERFATYSTLSRFVLSTAHFSETIPLSVQGMQYKELSCILDMTSGVEMRG